MSLNLSPSLLALSLLGSSAFGAPQVAAQEPYLKDSDLSKLGKAIAEHFTARDEKKKIAESEEDFSDALDKLAKGLRKAPIDELLASPADMGRALWYAFEYPKKKIKKGKIEDREFVGAMFTKDAPLEYALWTPSKYNGKTTAYPMILTIPDVGETPSQHLQEQWENGDIRAAAILACPKMPDDVEEWTKNGGLAAVMITMREVYFAASTDFDRIYLSGRGKGAAAAVAIAERYPHRFAGVIGRAGDAGTTQPNNFSNLPTLFAGGGGEATAFEKAAGDLGWDNVTVSAEAKQEDIWSWIQGNPRKAYPESVTLFPGDPFPTRAYWLEIPPGSGTPGSKIVATIDRDNNSIKIDADGVSKVTLYLNDLMLDLSKPVTVITNDTETKELVPRSRKQFLSMAYSARIDPGEIFVARLQVTVTPKAEETK